MGWSILMTWVYHQTGKSALIAGYLFHTAFNTWSLVLLTNAIPGEPMPPFDVTLFIVASMVVALAGIGVVVATKGKLGYNERSA
jgi:hypothetical protein